MTGSSWSIAAEETRVDRCIHLDVLSACQILGHLDNIVHGHVGLRKQVHDILPGKLGLACDIGPPAAERPGVPEVMSQRMFGPTAMASLYLPM